ncbi:MAG TPA: peptide-methionine (R)-S-oxide reductase MsrB [Myxococcota bacterium]
MRHTLVVVTAVLIATSSLLPGCSQGASNDRGVDAGATVSSPTPSTMASTPPPATDTGDAMPTTKREVEKTTEEWKALLSPETFHVMFEKGTERPFCGGGSWDEHRKGVYHCAACDALLFNSDAKFDSGTGWPSFKGVAIEGAVDVVADRSHGMVREEVVCHRCGGHLGHVFDDGPPPTHKRYCMNGVAMKFVPDANQPAAPKH